MAKRSIKPAVAQPLDELGKLFSLRGEDEVTGFLSAHPVLLPLLLQAHARIMDYFPERPVVALEVVRDPEVTGVVELFACIQTDSSPEAAGARLRRFDREWFLQQLPKVRGLLNLDLEFR